MTKRNIQIITTLKTKSCSIFIYNRWGNCCAFIKATKSNKIKNM